MKHTMKFLHSRARRGLLLTFSLTLLLFSCRKDYQKYARVEIDENVTPVQTELISKVKTTLPVPATGILGSDTETRLSFKIGGVIDRIYVEEGDRFKAGQVLATLELSEINAQVRKATEGVNKYSRDRDRVQNLYADSVATLEQMQDIETALALANSDLEIARFNQKYARIVARSSGRVLKRFAEAGELVSPGMPLLWVSNQGNKGFVLKATVSDKDIVRLDVGDSARVYFDAYANHSFAARISEVAQQADPRSGTFEVELAIAPGKLPLKNGFIGKAILFPSQQGSFYRIPMDAIVEAEGGKAKIFLADIEEQRAIEHSLVFSEMGNDFLLADGKDLALDLPVVVAGAAYLKHNSPISIQKP